MRCKNCKKKVENENLLRCPHCGKMLPKKKNIDKKKLVSTMGFVFVSVCFFILSFLSFFFQCSYYSSGVMIIGIIVFTICIPFVIGGFGGITKKHNEIFAVIMSLPFIVNWFVTFIMGNEAIDFGGFCTAYYWSALGAVILCDTFLILSASEIIKKTKLFSYVALGLLFAIFGLTIAYFSISGAVQPIGIAIISIQNIMPAYMAFYALNKEE